MEVSVKSVGTSTVFIAIMTPLFTPPSRYGAG
jgi:hypothetical protein